METARISDGLKMNFDLDDEFYARVAHNFKTYVLLYSKSRSWREDEILASIFRFSGYKSHKIVKYRGKSSHIHVKFENEHQANEAVQFLQKLSSDLTAILVDDLIRDWFNYEVKAAFGPPATFTIVDIVGNPPLALNFLTSNIIDSIFKDFGRPCLLPYTAALTEPHVQVVFNSMAEALATCMAFGEWYDRNEKLDSFCYRVRIYPSYKEAWLINNSGGIPDEAFKLDYFYNVRKEIFPGSRRPESYKDRTARFETVSQNRDPRKWQKQKYTATNTESENSPMNRIHHRTPIVCVPIIAPLNNISEAFSKQIGDDVANALLNIQNSSSYRLCYTSKMSGGTTYPAIQYGTSESLAEGRSLDCLPTENNHTEDSNYGGYSEAMSSIPAPRKKPFFNKEKRSQTRVFERRK